MLTTELPRCHLFDDTYVLVRCAHTLTKTLLLSLLFHSLGLCRYTLLKSHILKKKKVDDEFSLLVVKCFVRW